MHGEYIIALSSIYRRLNGLIRDSQTFIGAVPYPWSTPGGIIALMKQEAQTETVSRWKSRPLQWVFKVGNLHYESRGIQL